MSEKKLYSERLKNMKESIEKNKDLLKQTFPDDVTTTGNPDLIRGKEKAKPSNHTESDGDEEAGSEEP